MIKRTILMALRIILAGILIVLGIIGLIMPVAPGWIFLIPGLGLLYREILAFYRAVQRWLAIIYQQFLPGKE